MLLRLCVTHFIIVATHFMKCEMTVSSVTLSNFEKKKIGKTTNKVCLFMTLTFFVNINNNIKINENVI
jgi:hypothetical protein